jgi:phosphocarrier protein
MVQREVAVVNVLGLHARAAARFVRVAGQFQSRITVTRDTHTMDGKSILGLLFLSAARGSRLVIAADGPDAEAAIDALGGLVARGFEDA